MNHKEEKISKEKLVEKIDEICIEQIGEEYRAKMESDDGGFHAVVYFEEKCPALAKKIFNGNFCGWRTIITIVPEGYLEVFHPLQKKDDFDEIQDW